MGRFPLQRQTKQSCINRGQPEVHFEPQALVRAEHRVPLRSRVIAVPADQVPRELWTSDACTKALEELLKYIAGSARR